MALAPSDERDLLLPLFGGIHEEPLWDVFLRRLLARTGAQRVSLFVTAAAPTKRVLVERVLFAPGAPVRELIDMDAFADSLLLAYGAPRANRVYSLEELLIRDESDIGQQQRDALDHAEISDARFIRIPTAGDNSVWLFLMNDRQTFGASESALLSELAPHVALAFGLLLRNAELRLRATMAEEALGLLGVGQAAFDADGHVVVADALAAEQFDLQASGRLQLLPQQAQALTAACTDLASRPENARRVVRLDERQGQDMLLRPSGRLAEGLSSNVAAFGIVRHQRPEREASAARIIADTLGLSLREAALALGISQGQSIVQAGTALQLTPETARNYSKRIYAKTSASGQADLVRMVLTGLAPFA